MTTRRKISWIFGAPLLISLVVVAACYPQIKSWRANSLFNKGLSLAESENTDQAIELLYASHQLDPERLDIIIELATLLGTNDLDKSLLFWQLLTERDPSQLHYWEKVLQSALAKNDQHMATETFSHIEEHFPQQLANADLYRVQLLILKDNYPLAIKLLNEMSLGDLTWQQLESLWNLLLPTNQELSQKYSFFRKQLVNPTLTPTQLDELLAISNQHGWLIPDTQLKTFSLSSAAESPLLQKEMTAYGLRHFPENPYWWKNAQSLFPLTTIADKKTFSIWLRQARRADLAIPLWTEEEALARRDSFIVYLDLLAAQDRWKEIRRLVQTKDAPLEEFLQFAFLARAQRELGQESRFDLTWQKAIRATLNKPESLVFLNNFAKQYNYTAAQLAVLERLKTTPALTEIAYREEVELYQRTGNTLALHQTLSQMAQQFPNNPAITNDLFYTTLLLHPTQAESILPQIEKLVESDPTILAYRVTLSLAYLTIQNFSAAHQVLDITSLDWTPLRGSWRAIKAITLKKMGQTTAAKNLQKTIIPQALLPEEAAQLKQVFN